MEKKIYEKPAMQLEEFISDDYCAGACGETEREYNFACDAPSGRMYRYLNSPATGEKPSVDTAHEYVGRFSPCPTTHTASTKGDFSYGFIDRNRNGREDEGEAAILYLEWGKEWHWWGEEDIITNGHATTNLNMKEWTYTKS